MMTVSNACRPPAMPQDQRRKSYDEYDVINSDFPPPSLKAPHSPEQEKRKKKKWSIGGLFRRKKKVSDTDSSSPLEEDEEKKGFLERRRARKRRNRGSKDVTGSFETVIINHRHSQVYETTPTELTGFKDAETVKRSHDSQVRKEVRGSSVSLEGAGKRGGRLHVKARVEASRERLRGDSSSDEGGGSSRHSSSSVQRLKADENMGSKDGSLSRRSRAARTERYKKRLSKDDEFLRDFHVPSRISRSDERLTSKKVDKPGGSNRWTAKVVYYESSDYDTKYTAITKSATPSPVQSPKARPKNALHYTASAPPATNYVTYPPSHIREGVAGSHQELRSRHYPLELAHRKHQDITPPRLPKSNSEMLAKSPPFPNSVQRHYPLWGQDALNRKSASYDCNVNNIHYVNSQISQPHPKDENVLVVQFPISRPAHKVDIKPKTGLHQSQQIISKQNPPPPPPPRDPHRRLVPSNGYHLESNSRPMSYAFEDRNTSTKFPGFPEFGSSSSAFQRVPQTQNVLVDLEPISSINKHHRSSSDNHIPTRLNVRQSPPMQRKLQQSESTHRMNSGSVDSYASSPPSDGLQTGVPHHYQYYTDQQPRSRKPIHIAYQSNKPQNDPYLSDSQVVVKPPLQQPPRVRPPSVQNAADFWKQKDQESTKKVHLSEGSPKLIQRHMLNVSHGIERSRSNSPLKDVNISLSKLKLPPLGISDKENDIRGSFFSHNSAKNSHSPRTPTGIKPPHNEIGIPVLNNLEVNSNSKRPLSTLEERQETSEQEVSPLREKSTNPPTPPTRRDSKVNAVTSFEHFDIFTEGNKDDKRKSNNLEEALNELEAIYKSLRLGEENYLEKVAKEKSVYENNRLDPSNWNAWVQSRGFESDSSFNYSRSSLESVDSIDSPLKRSNSRRSGVPDRVTDDMAYRRLNKKDRPPPHEQEVISQAGSFLLVSPTLSPPPFVDPPLSPQVKKEPDIEKDDVVYRNIKHVNNTLKCLDPQPPFGIPLGPITPAPNSDYLHVSPKETFRPSFKPRKVPDVVTDDLAFRNLRKDNNKEPLFTTEEISLVESPTLKKKRAVRSLSANLLSIIQRESMAMKNECNKLSYNNNNIIGELEKSQSFTDVSDTFSTGGTNGKSLVHRKTKESNQRNNVCIDDSDTTPRASRSFSTGNSTPQTATSTETLTGSKNSLFTPEVKSGSAKLSNSPSPRLSLTPERRHTTDSIHLPFQKSPSPSKNVISKIECEIINTGSSFPKSNFHRSPTPDSHTYTHHSGNAREDAPVLYDEHESDLLAILAREAKEASEQLSKELNELSFDKDPKTHRNDSLKSDNLRITNDDNVTKTLNEVSSSQNISKPLPLGKIIPHKPVKLSTFHITEDNKLESKQTIVTNKPVEVEGSKSMTDLLKELTRSLDIDFGNSSNVSQSDDQKDDIKKGHWQNEINKIDITQTPDINFNEKETRATNISENEDNYFTSTEEIPEQPIPELEKYISCRDNQSYDMEKNDFTLITTSSFPPIPSSQSVITRLDNSTIDPTETSKENLSVDYLELREPCQDGQSSGENILESSVSISNARLDEEKPLQSDLKDFLSLDTTVLNTTNKNVPLEENGNELLQLLSQPNEDEQVFKPSSPKLNRFPLELSQDEELTMCTSVSNNKDQPILDRSGVSADSKLSADARHADSPVDHPRDSLDYSRITDEGKTCLKGCVSNWTTCVHERS